MVVNGIKLCINCMHPLNDDTNKCNHCGYIQSEYRQIPCCLSPGTVLSKRYVIGKVIGEGSFGITYIGWDMLLEYVVAIKEYFPLEIVNRDTINGNTDVYMISQEYENEYKSKLTKFLDEARCLSKFNSLSGIVSVRDFFYSNETAYIVMEYVDGCSLKDYIKANGKMSGKQVLELMKPVINAISEVHKLGIVHRDISPDNILFSKKGELVLIDFGSSRVRDIDLMRSMTVTFKRGFSPEEQYRSRGVLGAWSDVYSLCATMYYMLTGLVPMESVERIVGGRIESLENMSDIDITDKQKKGIMKGLEVEAKDRYQSVHQLYITLYDETEKHVDKNVSNNKINSRLFIYIGAVAVVVLLAIVGIKVIMPAEKSTEIPMEVSTEAPTETPTEEPTETPTEVPTEVPTKAPTEAPTEIPTKIPKATPAKAPTDSPTQVPKKNDKPNKPDEPIGEINDSSNDEDIIGVIQ